MTNRSRLVSGRVPTSNSANVTSDRYQFLDLSSAEPNLGAANTGDILSYNSNYPGGRQWIASSTLVSGNTQQIFDKANSANVLAQAAYNQANTASANTIVLSAVDVSQNANIAIALAGVQAANINISFLTGFSQSAFDKANSANALAQAAFDKANSAEGLIGFEAFNKANAANVLAQAAYDNSNTKFSSSGGNINGDVNIINNKNLFVTGNLTVQGNLITTNTQSFEVSDPLILLGTGNYFSDLKDIGFVSHYNDGVNAHAGFVRDFATKEWFLFKDYIPELGANNQLNITDPSFRTANLNADLVRANLVGKTAVVNNIELGGFTQAAYNFANSANVLAQAAYNAANAAGSSAYVQGAFDKANSANVLAQAAYNQANTAGANTVVLTAINTAQNANIAIALAGLTAANANIAIAQAGVVAANSNISYLINTFVPAAYNAANTAQLQALNAFGFAQASYNQANSALGIALSAGIQANVANSIANTALQNTASIVTAGNLTVSNNLTVTNNVAATNIITNSVVINKVGGGISGANTVSANTLDVLNAIITSSTPSSSNTTGALLVTGGVGVQGNLYATAVYSNGQIVLTSEPIGQNAFDKANAANVLAQAAFDYANSSSGGALAQAAFNKANSANVLAQAAFNAANSAVQTTGGTITGTLNVANIIETGKTITVAANTSWNTNAQLANSGIVVGNLAYKSNSVYFDGTEDSLTLSPGVTVGANEYTIEFWMYLLDANVNTPLGIIGTNTTNAFNLRLNSNTEIQIDKSFASSQLFTIPTIQSGTWYHIAAVRDVSNRATVFVNGVRSSTGYLTNSLNYSGPTNSIASTVSTANYSPYLSNIRIITNNTLYDPTQTNITVPTSLLGTVTGTQYLGAQYAATYDASGNQTVTVNADARAEFFSPFYNTSAISLLYDGANNWLTYGGITAAGFYSNGLNVLNFAKAAFDFANTAAGGTAADGYARIVANSTAIVANIVGAGLVATNTNTAIALAGVAAANSNISFLTGFSQGAFDKANAANVLAQAAYDQANIVTAGLVATNTNTAIALAGVEAANSNINVLYAVNISQNANIAIALAGVEAANANIIALYAVNIAQNANIAIALAGVEAANANIIALQAGLNATNTNVLIALAGVEAANSNISFLTGFSQNAFNKANAAYDYANALSSGITSFTQGAFDKANSASANTIVTQAIDISQNANIAIALAGVQAANSNISFLTGFSQNAHNKANAAYDFANTKLANTGSLITVNGSSQLYISNTSETALSIAGGVSVSGNLITSLITASGNILPSVHNTYYLGQPSQRWHSLYVGPGSIDIGGIVLGNTGGALSIGASDIQITPPEGQAPLPSFSYTANTANSAQANTIVTQGVDLYQNNLIGIVQGGLDTANSNISFLLGFSQGAYDKANTTATVANSTAVVANIVAAGLVATNTNTAIALAGVAAANANIIALYAGNVAQNANISIALAGVAAANSNISFLTGFSQNAFNKANAAYDYANSISGGVTAYTQAAFEKANSANVLAQAAYDNSNTKFSSSGGNITGDVNIINGQNLVVSGNLTVQGNLVTTNTQSFTVADPLILLGTGNYFTDLKDIGFTSHYNDGVNAHAGFFRDFITKEWYVFKDYVPEIGAENQINIHDATFKTANINADIVRSNLIGTTAVVNNIELGGFTRAAYYASNVVAAGLVATNTNTAIALAGVQAANSNISFLTGFSQGAFNTANTTATVANSTAVVANIVAAGLVATNTNTAIALAGVEAANSNISFLTGFSQGAYDTANTTATVANSTAVVANIVAAGLVATNTNVAIALAGVEAANSSVSFLLGFSQGAYDKANTTATVANSTAVVANIVAAGLVSANSNISFLTGFSQGAFNKANAALPNTGSLITVNSISEVYISNTSQTALTIAGGANIIGNLITSYITTSGNVLPSIDNTYYLGQPGQRWHSLYVGPGSVDIDGIVLGNSEGALSIAAADIQITTLVGQAPLPSFSYMANTANSAQANTIVTQGVDDYQNNQIGIVQGGLNTANDNISFLTGFSQNAFNKANAAYDYANTLAGTTTTAQEAFNKANSANVLAQAAYNQANTASGNTVVLTAGLVATNTNTAIALAGVVAANANISFLTGFSQGGYNQANSANALAHYAADKANAAYDYANTLTGTTAAAQAAFDKANSANVLAQAAYNQANVAIAGVQAANANIGFLTAFSKGAYDKANTTATVANSTAFVANTKVTYDGWTPNSLIFANATGYLSNVSNLQFNSSNSSLYVNGLTNLNYTGFAGSQNAALVVSGSNTKGGIGYVDFLQATNLSANVTNPSKYFRLDNSGTFQIINSAYDNNIFQVDDSGNLVVPQKLQGNYIQFGDGSKQYTANAGSGGGGVSSQDAFDKANSANVLAQSAFNKANAAYDYANTIISGGGSDTFARDKANSANVLAQYAADKANAAFNYANTISGGSAEDSYARIVANSTAIVANIVAAGLVSTNTNTAIALAGVAAANSNISFLTGFSQGAYDKANSASGGNLAQAAFDKANVVAAGLVSTNANVSIALAGVEAANSNISFLTGFSQSAYDTANTTATVANSTAVVANVVAAGLVATNTNVAIALAGVEAANANIIALYAGNVAQNANIAIALAGVQAANANLVILQSGLDTANANISFLIGFSQGAYDKANTGGGGDSAAAFNKANSANVLAQAAFDKANIGGGAVITTAPTPPASGNNAGDQWYNTDNDVYYEYTTSDGVYYYWIDITSPAFSSNAITFTGVSSGKAIAYALIFGG
jgi:hypothetical protein